MTVPLLERYREFLPIGPRTPLVTLGEGNTPLVEAPRLAQTVGCKQLLLKMESCNPTGSFKDRGMAMAVAKALEEGSSTIICASTGNTSASAAAYGARCGLITVVLVPKGNIALGKMVQALVYGARVIALDGTFDQALQIVRALTQRHDVALVNSLNPHRIEGQKTAAFEIVDDLGEAPDYLFIPVGNAGNITAYWKGFLQYHHAGRAETTPKMMGFEAEGAAPIVRGQVVTEPHTVATAIRIGNPASWRGALAARDDSGGFIGEVSDEEILQAYHLLASQEGVFGEPASAASFAGLMKLARAGMDFSGSQVVCVITGSGLKDPDTAMGSAAASFSEVVPTVEAAEEALGWR